jgi:hypothetical protein
MTMARRNSNHVKRHPNHNYHVNVPFYARVVVTIITLCIHYDAVTTVSCFSLKQQRSSTTTTRATTSSNNILFKTKSESHLTKSKLFSSTTTSEEAGNINIHYNDDIIDDETTKSYLEIIDPRTNATVVLVGCLHGASSSAKDVEIVLNEKPTDVVVLELCPTRYKDLMKYVLAVRSNSNDDNNGDLGADYIRMVSNTIETKGISTGIAAAILGGASGLSTALSGFEAGLEFITAIDYVQKCSDMATSTNTGSNISSNENGNKVKTTTKDQENKFRSCDIILGDQIVDETLKRVGSIPTVSINMWKTFCNSSWNWDQTYGKDAMVLSNAVLGDRELKKMELQIDMKSVLLRNKDVVIDLLRLTLPSFLLLQFAIILSSASTGGDSLSLGSMIVDLSPTMSQTDWVGLATDFGVDLLTSALILLVGYISLALPAVKVVLSERDVQLVDAINAACDVASEKQNMEGFSSPPRVVAVLGLLHVNGIAKMIVDNDQ